jgi:ABC-type multidrug transport system ATPase subunit
MKIIASNIAKKFDKDWIFKNLNVEFCLGNNYAITGNNGSGKSTLLQCIAGFSMCTKGNIIFEQNGSKIEEINHHKFISIAAPYLELVEEMTALELLQFHHQFKPFYPQITFQEILQKVNLQSAANKQIKNFSSGMKQRLKLAQAIFSNSPILLLDEPCSNLDEQGIQLYHQLIQHYCSEKLIIVCSNDAQEYSFCQHTLNIQQFK